MTATGPAVTLRADLNARISSNWWLKFFGITAFITLFFVVYFLLLRFPMHPVTVMPLTWLDRLIPFQPMTLGLYLTLWFYVSLPPTLLRTKPELYAYGWLAALVAVIALAIFFFWPTSTPVTSGVEWNSYPGFRGLRSVDAAQNACPSLHVAYAVFTGLWLDRVLRTMPVDTWVRVASAVWCLGIVYSTISTRQHVAVDVAAGAVLGLLAGWIRPARLCRNHSSR